MNYEFNGWKKPSEVSQVSPWLGPDPVGLMIFWIFPPNLEGGGGGSQVDLFIPDWPTKNPTVFFRRGKKLQSFLRGSLQSNYTSGRIDGYRHSLPSGDDL